VERLKINTLIHLRRFLVLLLLLTSSSAIAGEPVAEALPPFDPAGIRGTLLLCGGGRIPDAVRDEFVRLAGAEKGKLVIIPAASGDDTVDADAAAVTEIWKSRGIGTITTLHTRSRELADSDDFCAPLRNATAVWITGGRQTQIVATYQNTLVETELRALINRGGVIGGTSAGAACQSRVMLVRGAIYDIPGFDLIPGSVVDQHFLVRNRKERLFSALERHPALVGLGVDEATGLVVHGRTLKCIGDSTVTICYGACGECACDEQVLQSGQSTDLTMLRRAIRDRLEPRATTTSTVRAEVPSGSLVIVGGGSLPDEIVERFIALAGGPNAPIVILPTANPDPLPPEASERRFLERAGATNVRVLSARRRDEVESPGFLKALEEARGIWFGGGRQWRFVDAYEGTKAIGAFRGVLARGGVIGGSSAGATIQGDLLVRGSPLGNEQMLCPGYQRGFAFLPGTAIDQHFTQRKRFGDMTGLMKSHPEILGIGLDEGTAIIVQGSTAEVAGNGKVHFYDGLTSAIADQPDHLSIAAGGKYNLADRKAIAGE
jgi:cyanophycinase